MNDSPFGPSLRRSASLLLMGHRLSIVVTQCHTRGDANSHPAIFAADAGSERWTVGPVGQVAATAVSRAGLLALVFALDIPAETAR